MRKTLVLTLSFATISAALCGVAAAQTKNDFNAMVAKTEARETDPGYADFERKLTADLDRRKTALAQTGVLSDVSAVEPIPPPLHWTGTAQAWRMHMARCQARFKSYDAQTDMYLATPTEHRRCTL